jgi:signal peptidase I
MATSKHKTMPQEASRAARWTKSIVDLALVVLVVLVGKAAIAEPFYVPSGSMEPTLLIGDELLATKYPYGYSTASLPAFINLPSTGRVLGALPKRGDVVVFRWPGDPSQVWVKRVIGLPGDRIGLRNGQVSINGQAATLSADGTGKLENDDGSQVAARRFVETLPGGRTHPIFKRSPPSRSTTWRTSSCRPATCS